MTHEQELEILEHLQHIQITLDMTHTTLVEIIACAERIITAAEDVGRARMQSSIDRIIERLERIEKRLDLSRAKPSDLQD